MNIKKSIKRVAYKVEKHFNVTPIGVKYVCDNCKKGDMQYIDGKVEFSDPPKFLHQCSNCGDTKYLEKKYPTVEYRFE
jgi:ssDNA-binding Zn-finger/Zn-ribbon topoisomerase 1